MVFEHFAALQLCCAVLRCVAIAGAGAARLFVCARWIWLILAAI